jgi:hypothetical protein
VGGGHQLVDGLDRCWQASAQDLVESAVRSAFAVAGKERGRGRHDLVMADLEKRVDRVCVLLAASS